MELVDLGMADVQRTLGQFELDQELGQYMKLREKLREAGKLALFPHTSLPGYRKLRSKFKYAFKTLADGQRLAVIVDLCDDEYASVTNDMENISKIFSIDHVVYRDTDEVWSYWGKELGFKTLHVKPEGSPDTLIPPPTMDIAITIAESRYIKK